MKEDLRVKDVGLACFAGLKGLGFKTVSGLSYYEINEDLYGWVGLNIAKSKDFIRINPNIGIHYAPVMRYIAEIKERKFKIGTVPTLSVPLGILLPNEEQLIVRDYDDINDEVCRLVSYLGSTGICYARRFLDLNILERSLLERVPIFGGYPERYALMLLINKKIVEFEKFATEQEHVFVENNMAESAQEWQQFCKKAVACVKRAG